MDALKFTIQSTVIQQITPSITQLNSLSDEQLSSFLSIAFDILMVLDGSQNRLEQFATNNGINSKTLNTLMQNVLFFLTECLKQGFKPHDVVHDIILLGLNKDKAENVVSVQYKKYSGTISGLMIDQTFKISQLHDLEWKFGVTTASSELSQVGTCFLQMKLTTIKDGEKSSQVFELSIQQFFSFLASLQTAQALIDTQ